MHKYIAKEPTGEVYRVEKLDKDIAIVEAVAQGLHRTDPQEFSLLVEKKRDMATLVPVTVVSHTLIGAPNGSHTVVLLDEAGLPKATDFDFLELAL